VRISTLPAIILAVLFVGAPLPSPAQLAIGVGFTIGAPPPPLPVYEQPLAPYPNYQWTPGYWGYGSAGYYWVPGTWVAPPSVGLYWTPGYWGYGGGGYGWNAGYWGPSVGFYGGINYGFGYPGTGFVGGVWSGGAFRYNTAVVRVNRTVIHNTYNKTVINKCTNCHVSFNGGHGGISAKPNAAQMQARRNGRPPTTDQRNVARVASQDRNLYANVNKGKPPVTAVAKPVNDPHQLPKYAPVTAADKQNNMKNANNANGGNKNGNLQSNPKHNASTNQAQHHGGQNPPSGTMHSGKHQGSGQGKPPSSMQSQGGAHSQGGTHQGSTHAQSPGGGGGGHQGGSGKPPGGGGGGGKNKPPK
jgi:hypothetical protein